MFCPVVNIIHDDDGGTLMISILHLEDLINDYGNAQKTTHTHTQQYTAMLKLV